MDQATSSQRHGNMCVLRTIYVIQQGHRGGPSHAHEVCSVVCINSIRLLVLSIAVVLGRRRLPEQGQRNFNIRFEMALPHFR